MGSIAILEIDAPETCEACDLYDIAETRDSEE